VSDCGIVEWVTAVGTLAAVVVALIVAFFPSIRRWYNRPILKIEFENREPFCRHSSMTQSGLNVLGYWVRLRVRNVGRSLARGCEGKLVRITNPSDSIDRPDFDPTILHWVGTAWDKLDNSIGISKDEYEYLDVLYVMNGRPDIIEIGAENRLPRGIRYSFEKQTIRDCTLHVVFYGVNIETVDKSFHLRLVGDEFDKIKLEPLA